jgi:hypothetical protein
MICTIALFLPARPNITPQSLLSLADLENVLTKVMLKMTILLFL